MSNASSIQIRNTAAGRHRYLLPAPLHGWGRPIPTTNIFCVAAELPSSHLSTIQLALSALLPDSLYSNSVTQAYMPHSNSKEQVLGKIKWRRGDGSSSQRRLSVKALHFSDFR
jgi:hypothetical protein